jgi:hypothetical protein
MNEQKADLTFGIITCGKEIDPHVDRLAESDLEEILQRFEEKINTHGEMVQAFRLKLNVEKWISKGCVYGDIENELKAILKITPEHQTRIDEDDYYSLHDTTRIFGQYVPDPIAVDATKIAVRDALTAAKASQNISSRIDGFKDQKIVGVEVFNGGYRLANIWFDKIPNSYRPFLKGYNVSIPKNSVATPESDYVREIGRKIRAENQEVELEYIANEINEALRKN